MRDLSSAGTADPLAGELTAAWSSPGRCRPTWCVDLRVGRRGLRVDLDNRPTGCRDRHLDAVTDQQGDDVEGTAPEVPGLRAALQLEPEREHIAGTDHHDGWSVAQRGGRAAQHAPDDVPVHAHPYAGPQISVEVWDRCPSAGVSWVRAYAVPDAVDNETVSTWSRLTSIPSTSAGVVGGGTLAHSSSATDRPAQHPHGG